MKRRSHSAPSPRTSKRQCVMAPSSIRGRAEFVNARDDPAPPTATTPVQDADPVNESPEQDISASPIIPPAEKESPTSPDKDNMGPLTLLPLEIRDMIYSHILGSGRLIEVSCNPSRNVTSMVMTTHGCRFAPRQITYRRHSPHPLLKFLASRQLYDDATAFLYRRNQICFPTTGDFISWAAIPRKVAAANMTTVVFDLSGVNIGGRWRKEGRRVPRAEVHDSLLEPWNKTIRILSQRFLALDRLQLNRLDGKPKTWSFRRSQSVEVQVIEEFAARINTLHSIVLYTYPDRLHPSIFIEDLSRTAQCTVISEGQKFNNAAPFVVTVGRREVAYENSRVVVVEDTTEDD